MTDTAHTNTIQRAKELLRRLVTLYMENAKLTVAEKLIQLFSALVMLVICVVFGIFALAFIAGAGIELLELVLQPWAAYLVLAGVFILIMGAMVIFRDRLIVNPTARFVTRLVFDRDHKPDAAKEASQGSVHEERKEVSHEE